MRSINILCIIAAVAALPAWPVAALADDEPVAAADDEAVAAADDEVVASPEDVIEVMEFAPGRDGYLPKGGAYSAPWMGLAFGLLAVAVILAPAFKSARRTHLN